MLHALCLNARLALLLHCHTRHQHPVDLLLQVRVRAAGRLADHARLWDISLGLLVGVHGPCDRVHETAEQLLLDWHRLGLIGRRPLRTRHDGAVLKELIGEILVQHLVGLVVLIDRVPAASRTAAAQDLPVLLERRLAAPLSRAAVPTPVNARLGAARIMGHLHEALPCLLLADEATGDILHEDGEEPAEPHALLAEERRLGDAPRVDGGERDSRLTVVAIVEHVCDHHQAELRILVCLQTIR